MSILQFHPPVIAHRGASGYAPENTLSAFTKAAQLGVKWIEFDVMLTADNIPVIFHDESLERTTNDHGLIADRSYAYLQTVDAGRWFDPIYSYEKIPSLRQVLQFLENTHLSANIEIKAPHGHEEALVTRVLAEVSPYLTAKNFTFLFSSFSIDALHCLRKYSPDCYLGLLMHEWLPNWKMLCKSLNCVSVHVNQEILNERRVHEIKATDRALLSYTVNVPERAQELFSYGVDAVFTDVPDKILSNINLTSAT